MTPAATPSADPTGANASSGAGGGLPPSRSHSSSRTSRAKPTASHSSSSHSVDRRLSGTTGGDTADYNRLQEKQHKAEHPLAGLSQATLAAMGREYAERELGESDQHEIRNFELGAVIAGKIEGETPDEVREVFRKVEGLTEEEREVLVNEMEHKWQQPGMLYYMVVICSLCAAVQGMDETVVNGAQSIYKDQFGIGGKSSRDTWLLGLTNAAPYLCCSVLGCWLTEPMNKAFGRRGTVFISCTISAITCIWQALTNTWWHMFIARFALGLGIGPKSATTPIFAAECSPKAIRGALVMQWQMWTAFGIMMGYAMDLAFLNVPDRSGINGLAWRLMMGSAGVPAIIVCGMIYMCPESPRWYLTKNRHQDAYKSMCRFRYTKVQAARDLFYANILLKAEKDMSIGRQNKLRELFTVRRNRNAMLASEIVMFMQQFCGVNVIAYYSSEIFLSANFSQIQAFSASLGFGVINFLFALPAFYTIDTFGRRNLLLTTFPLMAIFLLFTGFSFWIPENSTAHIACIALGIYLFGVVYSPGEGPVPFTYSAEAYPLYIRAIGMSLATATTWFFNFILAVTWPSLQAAFTNQGAFGWYAAWNVIGFILVLLFLPETKNRTLEELDAVFDVPLSKLARYGIAQARWFIQHRILRRDIPKPVVPHGQEHVYAAETNEKGVMSGNTQRE